jgi:exonuclease VII large subunit
MPRTRLSAILYLILVFASGVLVGVASTRLYAVKASVPAPAPRTMAEFTRRYTDEMRQRIAGVNDQQVAAVEKILADSKKRYDDLRREQRPMRDRIQQEQVDSIREVMTDAQKPAYEAWRVERLKRSKTGASGSSGSAK